jgi:hypothetical protein
MRWPIGIAAALIVVVAVNVAFIWIAVTTAPEIEASYVAPGAR